MFKRLLSCVATLLVCSFLIFVVLILTPGDPVDHLLGERGTDPKLRKELMTRWGFDRPLYEQYFIFVSRAVKGDLGHSLVSGRPVWEEFKSLFPATVELSVLALLVALLVGLPLGFLSAWKANSFWDTAVSGCSLVAYSMSVFWWGLVLILCFSVYMGWTPVSGRINVLHEVQPVTGFMLFDSLLNPERWTVFKSALKHLILPVLTLASIPLAYITRITRFSLLEVFKEDFIRTARSKGLGFYRVYCLHAFRNVLIPLITVTGFLLASLLAGAVLTETVFSWPGVGRWLVQAVLARDYPVLRGGILLLAVIIIFVNLMVDVLYLKADPRISQES